MPAQPTVDQFRQEAAAWLRSTGLPERPPDEESEWGVGPDDVAVFHDLGHDEELALIRRLAAWQRTRLDAGFGAITWPEADGGRGLSQDHAEASALAEQACVTPPPPARVRGTTGLVAPTVRLVGTAEQRARF